MNRPIHNELSAIRNDSFSACKRKDLYHYTTQGEAIRKGKQLLFRTWSPFEMERGLFQGLNVISNRLLRDNYLAEAGWILKFGHEFLEDIQFDIICFSDSPRVETLWNRCAPDEQGECCKLELQAEHPWQNPPDVSKDEGAFLASVHYDSERWWDFYESLWQKLDEYPTDRLFAENARLSSWNAGNDSLLRILFLLDYIIPMLPFVHRPDFAKEEEIRLVRLKTNGSSMPSGCVPLGKDNPLRIRSFVKRKKPD